jgi:hypothetical protein
MPEDHAHRFDHWLGEDDQAEASAVVMHDDREGVPVGKTVLLLLRERSANELGDRRRCVTGCRQVARREERSSLLASREVDPRCAMSDRPDVLDSVHVVVVRGARAARAMFRNGRPLLAATARHAELKRDSEHRDGCRGDLRRPKARVRTSGPFRRWFVGGWIDPGGVAHASPRTVPQRP